MDGLALGSMKGVAEPDAVDVEAELDPGGGREGCGVGLGAIVGKGVIMATGFVAEVSEAFSRFCREPAGGTFSDPL